MAIAGIAGRLRWLEEIAFPPAEYLREKYPEKRSTWLPLPHARRGLAGVARLIHPGS